MLKRFLTLPILLLAMACTAAEPEDGLTAGKDFQAVGKPQPTADPTKIEVAEVFWYGCPHCFSLEPHVQKWKETIGPDVKFVRMPATLNKTWRFHARAYYTAEVLGVEEKIHQPLFDALNVQKKQLITEAKMQEFFAEFAGVDQALFKKTWDSFSVETALSKTDQKLRAYRMTSVPTLVVNGKAWVNGRYAGSTKRMFEIVDALVERERQARSK